MQGSPMYVPTLRKFRAQRFPSVVPQRHNAPLPAVGPACLPHLPLPLPLTREVMLPLQRASKWEWEHWWYPS